MAQDVSVSASRFSSRVEIESLCKWNVPTGWNGKRGRGYLRRSSVCFGRFLFDPRISFAFQPFNSKLWLNMKAMQAIISESRETRDTSVEHEMVHISMSLAPTCVSRFVHLAGQKKWHARPNNCTLHGYLNR